jgi:hypothetical protein
MTTATATLKANRTANQSRLLEIFFTENQHGELKLRNGFFVEIKGTKFGAMWHGGVDGEDDFELLTNYSSDGSYNPMRKSFSGTLAECVRKAKNITNYYASLNS